ncbi:sulfonate ABC transporter substrate-binding protein [Paraburkholderia silvatlantica]|uniref:Sulfonate transport system substrate-binding protein n=1 Tax=Paraburkholderia silvatlantica TaxID=321895 RepID=A0ABR6FVN4_9BURK|nr:sulfonate ABC transporter substrate-binding protein [Paraburkholderia silvatlantica]MBB2931505.1 sulfonate transport system substrate-binding protein [Paraburkholderia silvatlantica]PVY27831.1 sulfonate transport system substrate-binding protein [Paraburkholderia silvatlantica]PXW34678.1 sulfonate transport system substrate-binding protein [Paraburkholderia silvatlantica]
MNARRNFIRISAAAAAIAAIPVLAASPARAASTARTLRIGNQKGYLSLLKGRGTLEKRLAPLGVSVTWTEFDAGPVQLEALNVGSIDFGDVGEAPPIFAQAAGAPLAYVAATVPRPQSEAVLVPHASAIRGVVDLKGKTVALNRGSNVHYFLVKLLQAHNVQYGDVKVVFLAPADARAAFERGSIDAWVIWDPFFAAAQKKLDARILADATGVVGNRAYYFSSLNYAKQNPDVIKILIDELSRIDQWGQANRAALATQLAQLWGLPNDVVSEAITRVQFGTGPITKAILAEQQQIANTFFDLKLIPKRVNVLEAAAPGIV